MYEPKYGDIRDKYDAMDDELLETKIETYRSDVALAKTSLRWAQRYLDAVNEHLAAAEYIREKRRMVAP